MNSALIFDNNISHPRIGWSNLREKLFILSKVVQVIFRAVFGTLSLRRCYIFGVWSILIAMYTRSIGLTYEIFF